VLSVDESVSYIIGRILLKLERYEEALTVYDELLRVSTSASIYLFKGIALQQLDRLTDALGAYQKAREHGFTG
jgi:tetratricopeptide (TPR) repeat protein